MKSAEIAIINYRRPLFVVLVKRAFDRSINNFLSSGYKKEFKILNQSFTIDLS